MRSQEPPSGVKGQTNNKIEPRKTIKTKLNQTKPNQTNSNQLKINKIKNKTK